jgi:hypothetical protein
MEQGMLPANHQHKLNGCIIKTALGSYTTALWFGKKLKVDGKGLLIKTR